MDFHDLAKNGKLNTIDPNLLTQENLTLQDEDGYTPLHCAANFGFLNQIPKQLLTQKNLTLKNNFDEITPIHWASENGHLDQIPPEFLTQKNLHLQDANNWTPFKNAMHFGHLNQLPYTTLKQNFELIKNTENIEQIMTEAKLKYATEISKKLQRNPKKQKSNEIT